jgi:hypothetical protein
MAWVLPGSSVTSGKEELWDPPETERMWTNSQVSHAITIVPRRDSDHCSCTPFDILIGGCPTGYADSHRRMSLPLRSSTPAGPIVLDICDNPPRVLRAAERDEHLVQDHVVQDSEPCLVQMLREHFRLAAVSLDHFL